MSIAIFKPFPSIIFLIHEVIAIFSSPQFPFIFSNLQAHYTALVF